MERFVRRVIHWWLLAACCVFFSGFVLSLVFSAFHAIGRHLH